MTIALGPHKQCTVTSRSPRRRRTDRHGHADGLEQEAGRLGDLERASFTDAALSLSPDPARRLLRRARPRRRLSGGHTSR